MGQINILSTDGTHKAGLSDGSNRPGSYYRYTLTPDTDIETIEDIKVKAIAEVTWTPEVIQLYLDSKQQMEEYQITPEV